MKIRELLSKNNFILSFEVFPPKREGNLESLYETIREIVALDPHFISVTYGAGGSTRDKTVEIASTIKNDIGREVLAHLTCVNATKDDIAHILDELKEKNIENILALRGDPPEGEKIFVRSQGGFCYANELVTFIRKNDDFSIGVAGYPEGHVEAPSIDDDIKNLKRKVDAGSDFIITQLFFDNDAFFRFRDRAITAGIHVPIIAGIFPIFNYKQIARMAELSGAKIPSVLHDKLYKVSEKSEEVEKYGIEYAIIQSEKLLDNEVSGLHFYSMNKSRHILRIVRDLPLPRRTPVESSN